MNQPAEPESPSAPRESSRVESPAGSGRVSRLSTTYIAVAGMIGTALVVLLAVSQLWPSRPEKPISLTITAGSASGLRHVIGASLADIARPDRIDLQVQPTSGSREAIERVDSGQIDLALVQGGLTTEDLENVRQAAVLHLEPLHLLVKADIINGSSATLNALRGRTVNLSSPGSGTHVLARDVLQFVGIDPDRDCQVSTLSYTDLLNEELSIDDIPDAVFTVSSLPSPIVRALVDRYQMRLMPIPIAHAYRIDWARHHKDAEGTHVMRRHVSATTVPAYTYGVDPPVPDRDIPTLGTHLQLVVNRNVKPDVVERVLSAVYDTSFASLADPKMTTELLASSPDYPLHAGVETYIEKHSPVITARLVELTEQVLAILGTVCGGLLFVWQALVLIRRKRRDRQFLICIERLVAIEEQALRYEFDDGMTVDDLVRFQGDVSEIKAQLVERFQSGDIDGADTLSAFLNHANDASEMLTRMILHDRNRTAQAVVTSAENTP